MSAQAVRLLAAEPDFGRGLPDQDLIEALDHAVFPTVTVQPGAWRVELLRGAPGVRGHVHGFLVLKGALTLDVRVAGRVCARLVTPSDVVLLDGVDVDSLPADWGWSILSETRLAVFDQRLLVVARQWPTVLSAIVTRASLQTRRAHLQQAISQLPRVEERLLALFWALADQLGTTRAEGVWIPFTLTHDTIARMIGARRPTVTLGLNALAEQGLLRRHSDGWLIERASLNLFRQA